MNDQDLLKAALEIKNYCDNTVCQFCIFAEVRYHPAEINEPSYRCKLIKNKPHVWNIGREDLK